ncbi:hypothetical protein KUTeg_010068 [Tegillarca granosa]|uniref:TLC domain-containing protein n=1 Tax=Tegillarca granosa TaxID=220873 RepID=A0ABQ9F5N5_TEGGR|nr:hypothetical protein KUTeg_010068 [Tegillarca granosa]
MESKVVDEIWPEGVEGAKYGALVVTISAILFYCISRIFVHVVPAVARQSHWRWKNITVSFIHSLLSGLWAVYEQPKMAEDVIKSHSVLAHTLISVSVGYFVYDLIDLLVYQRNRQTYELIGHHIITCFSVAIVTKYYIGYAVISLIVELNSVFLHMRQLLQICGYPKQNKIYRLNSLVNLGTFVACRIAILAWMSSFEMLSYEYYMYNR